MQRDGFQTPKPSKTFISWAHNVCPLKHQRNRESPSHYHLYRWYCDHSQSWVVYYHCFTNIKIYMRFPPSTLKGGRRHRGVSPFILSSSTTIANRQIMEKTHGQSFGSCCQYMPAYSQPDQSGMTSCGTTLENGYQIKMQANKMANVTICHPKVWMKP